MKKILLIIIIVLAFVSCRSKYYMPNDTFKRNSNYQDKWYSTHNRRIIKTAHHPRWENNYKR